MNKVFKYTTVHRLCDFLNERPSNSPPVEWWHQLYDDYMEPAENYADATVQAMNKAKKALVEMRNTYIGILDQTNDLHGPPENQEEYKGEMLPNWVVSKLKMIDEAINALE